MIEFFVPGPPQGKGRARAFVFRRGRAAGRIGHYTPEKTRTYEGIITTLAMQARGALPPLAGPVVLTFAALMPVPDSWPQWKRAAALAGGISPTVKPDLDNIEKALKDGLNGVLWKDDAQVVSVVKEKLYAPEAGLRVQVRPHHSTAAQEARRAA